MLRRVKNGYELTLDNATLMIADDGRIWDKSGDPLRTSEVHIALGYLDADLKRKVWAWWNR